MTASTLVILTAALALGAPSPQQQQTPPPAKPDAAEETVVTLTGCVVTSPDREDSLRLVPAEPEPGLPVGTAGISPAWTVPAYLLLGGIVNFAEHANKTVEVTGTLDPPGAPVNPEPKRTGDTTTRQQQAAVPVARLHVRTAKVLATTCLPRK